MVSAGAEGFAGVGLGEGAGEGDGDGCGAAGVAGEGWDGCTFSTAARCVRSAEASGYCAAIVFASVSNFMGSVSFASSVWTNATIAAGIDGSSGGPPGSPEMGSDGADVGAPIPPRSVVAFA